MLEDGTRYRSRRQAGVLGRHRRSDDRQLCVARRRAESGPHPAARHVRPRRGRRRRARRTRCSCRSRASRATPRARRTAMVVGRDGKVEVRAVQGQPRDRRQVAGRGRPGGRRPGDRRGPAEDPARRARAGDGGRCGRQPPRPSPRRSRRPGRPWHASSSTGPIFAWVIAIIIMLAGGLAITQLPISMYPNIAPPSVIDQRDLSGRLGEGRRGLGDADHRAEHEGARRPDLHVVDQRGQRSRHDHADLRQPAPIPDIAQVQVQNKLQLAMPSLPQAVQRQGINVSKSRSGSCMVVGFVSTDGSMGRSDIADYVDRERGGSAEPRPGRRHGAGLRFAVRDAHLARPEQARHL